METKQSQIKINLPLKLKKKIEKRAGEYDFTLAGYLKYLAVSDLKWGNNPPVRLSERTIEAIRQAKIEEKNGTLREISDLDDYFAKLGK